eukprot:281034-Pelagomonas_calceolata.AAC.4
MLQGTKRSSRAREHPLVRTHLLWWDCSKHHLQVLTPSATTLCSHLNSYGRGGAKHHLQPRNIALGAIAHEDLVGGAKAVGVEVGSQALTQGTLALLSTVVHICGIVMTEATHTAKSRGFLRMHHLLMLLLVQLCPPATGEHYIEGTMDGWAVPERTDLANILL